uniref:Tuberculin-active protein n=1 Tax=Mycobacterium tuberculosis TaxID=1773 RepID=TUBE_MYCTX|nr:RecName: Full=Tuberculin-active protein [Mycobacterium tuberculosis]
RLLDDTPEVKVLGAVADAIETPKAEPCIDLDVAGEATFAREDDLPDYVLYAEVTFHEICRDGGSESEGKNGSQMRLIADVGPESATVAK